MKILDKTINHHDLIEVLWTDSCRQFNGWIHENDIKYDVDVDFANSQRSAGYALKVHRGHFFFAQEKSDIGNMVGNVLSCPVSSIYGISILKKMKSYETKEAQTKSRKKPKE